MTVMSLKLAAACLRECIAKDIPAFVWGPPGVGKSETVKAVAKELNMGLIDFRLSLRDPVDLRGLPLVDAKTGTTRWLPPSELPNVKDHGKTGILFLDEANIASQAMQGSAMGLVLDRRLGEYVLPKGWVPIAAGNRMADKAAAQRMPTALRNRYAHYEIGVDLEAWSDWAEQVQLDPMVLAFIRWRPELLHKMPVGEENAFPTPRAWSQVAKVANCDKLIRQHMVASLVGDGPAAEFEGFARVWAQLPSIKQIFTEPSTARVPSMEEPSAMYAVSSAISRRVERENFAQALVYAKRLPKEFEVMLVTSAVKRDPSLTKNNAFAKWAVNNQEIVI